MKLKLLPDGLDGIRRLFLRDGEDRHDHAAAGGHRSLIDTVDFSDLTLEEILKTEPGLLAVRLHVLTLRRFKEMIADDWSRYADKVALISDGVFRRFLGPRQIFGHHGDDTFILSFADLDPVQGRHLAVTIANELMHRLIGDRFAGAQICVGEVDRDALLAADGEIDVEAIEQAVTESEPIDLDQNGAAGRSAEPPSGAWQALDAPDGSKAQPVLVATAPSATRSGGGAPEWRSLSWPPGGKREDRYIDPGSLDQPARLPEGIGLAFRPTWSTRWCRVTAYLCLPTREADGRRRIGHAVLPDGAGPDVAADLDFALVFGALAQILESIEARHGTMLIVPVRFATFQAPYWNTLSHILREFSDAARMRYLTLEVTDIPRAATGDHLIGLGQMARPLCRDLLLRTSVSAAMVDRLRLASPTAVGCAVPSRQRHAGKAVLAAARQFAKSAPDLRTYWWGVGERSAVQSLGEAGAQYVNGPAIGPDLPLPSGDFEVAV